MYHKKTRIVCTIGPASEDFSTLKKMAYAGMNVARLNFSHGSYENFTKIIDNIRLVSKELDKPIALLQDLQGPKIRIGQMPKEGMKIEKNSTVTLTTKKIIGYKQKIPVQYKNLPRDIKKNDKILLHDGLMELKVLEVKKTDILCRVIIGGTIKSHIGINAPEASLEAHPLTSKDKKDLAFGLKNDVDYVALSFVRNAKNIEELRSIIRQKHAKTKIIAKIERHEAIANLEEIIHEADGVMVARGDLGTEILPEHVPVIQKKIIHLANLHGKPVITATEMLQSMISSPRATRAEISDAANAMFDHTDAVMLSNESAVGKYPVQAVQTLKNVALSIEKEIAKHEYFLAHRLFKTNVPVSYATCATAAELAIEIDARCIVALTLSGFTAQHIAKHRINIPIFAITEDKKIQQQLQLVWGIQQVFLKRIKSENFVPFIRSLLLEKKAVQTKDKVVIVSNASKAEKVISTIII